MNGWQWLRLDETRVKLRFHCATMVGFFEQKYLDFSQRFCVIYFRKYTTKKKKTSFLIQNIILPLFEIVLAQINQSQSNRWSVLYDGRFGLIKSVAIDGKNNAFQPNIQSHQKSRERIGLFCNFVSNVSWTETRWRIDFSGKNHTRRVRVLTNNYWYFTFQPNVSN